MKEYKTTKELIQSVQEPELREAYLNVHQSILKSEDALRLAILRTVEQYPMLQQKPQYVITDDKIEHQSLEEDTRI